MNLSELISIILVTNRKPAVFRGIEVNQLAHIRSISEANLETIPKHCFHKKFFLRNDTGEIADFLKSYWFPRRIKRIIQSYFSRLHFIAKYFTEILDEKMALLHLGMTFCWNEVFDLTWPHSVFGHENAW